MEHDIAKITCAAMLKTELASSKLPLPVQEKLSKQFAGKTFTVDTMQAAIRAEKVMLDQLSSSGVSLGGGDTRISIIRDSMDTLQAAFDGMFKVRVADTMKDVQPFASMRAAYVHMTSDADITGVLNPQQLRRMQAAYGDTTFSYVLGNTLYRRIVQDYREIPDYGVSRLVGGNIRNAKDFRPLESIRVGYYGDLPDVDTDTEDYPDLGEVSDEKVEYSLAEKGGIITINRRMLINDDTRLVEKIIKRLPRAARRTLAKRVWDKIINNAVYKGDGKTIFCEDHKNLGSSAYGITSALAARTALFDQLEPDSGEKIGIRPATVAFPSNLFGIVKNVNDFNPQAVSVESGNSMYGFFKPEGLLESALLTDPNDWYMFADPDEVEIVELAFLNGQQEPLVLIADNPTTGGQMFVGGRIQYRISHDYEAEVVDFRGMFKSVVAPN